jgi:hypothetical protein
MSGFKFSFIPTEESEAPNATTPASASADVASDRSHHDETMDFQIQTSGTSHDPVKTKSGAAPSLTSINIPAIMSTMKSSPEAWMADAIQLSHHTILKRIALTEKPFDDRNSNNPKQHQNPNRIEEEETDLIPGYYEGGLKVWECSIDLCNHLLHLIQELQMHQSNLNSSSNEVENTIYNDLSHALSLGKKRTVPIGSSTSHSESKDEYPFGSTLELGCGHGLPACIILRELLRLHADADVESKPLKECEGLAMEDHDGDDIKKDGEVQVTGPIVIFTDYNHFVLKDVTLPNIILNCCTSAADTHANANDVAMDAGLELAPQTEQDNSSLMHQYRLDQYCSLFAGDWLDLSKIFQKGSGTCTSNVNDTNAMKKNPNIPKDGKFDLILAAETTYTPSSCNDTAYLLLHHLKPDTGVGFIATKRYYFGVGGGSDSFRDAIGNQPQIAIEQPIEDGTMRSYLYGLSIELVKDYNDGKSNIRDLWKVKCLRR